MYAWLFLLAAVTTPPWELTVAARAGDQGLAACTLRDAHGQGAAERLRPADGQWRWSALEGDELSCASAGFEPLDLRPADADAAGHIERPLRPARSLTLHTAWPERETIVEWRELAAGGTTLVARRRTRRSEVTLSVATESRVLRLHLQGLSPVSLFLAAGTSPLEMRVPQPQPGGELFGVLPAHAFKPIALELHGYGPPATLEPDSSHVFQASGLAPAAYTLTPLYVGGVRGKPTPVTVQPNQTEELLPLALEEPGAAALFLAPGLCDRNQLPLRLGLRRVNDDGSIDPRAVAELTLAAPPCDQQIEGLAEGTYQATLTRTGRTRERLSAARFFVNKGETTSVTLAAAEVEVSGRLSLGGRPGASILLLFTGADGTTWRVRTDDSGEYAVTLGPAGDYDVAIPGDRPSRTFTRPFQTGQQRADFDLGGATLFVRANRQDGSSLDEPVELTVTRTRNGEQITSSWPPGEEPARVEGLDLGEYWVTGRTRSGLASENTAHVELTEQEPTAEVQLALGSHEGWVRVVDESGMPLPDAKVPGHESEAPPKEPGLLPLGAVPVGEWIRVSADGYVPACRIVQPRDLPEMRVVLRKATDRATISIDPTLPWDSARLLNLPGSDCSLALTEMELEVWSGDRVVVKLALPQGDYRLAIGDAVRSVRVPGSLEISGGSP